MMKVRGVRGAITVEENTAEEILTATRLLLDEVIGANAIDEDDVASVIFTTTPELTAAFPAKAARRDGLDTGCSAWRTGDGSKQWGSHVYSGVDPLEYRKIPE